MKKKPDISGFGPLKDPTLFLESGLADRIEKPYVTPPVALAPSVQEPPGRSNLGRSRSRVQKIFNFPEELANQLRDEAVLRSKEMGSRVTEKDIVIEALEAYLKRA